MPEPQLQQQLKIEVFPAGFDEPVLVKEKNSFDFTPTKPGALARPTPVRPTGKPTMTESIQSNKPLKSAVPVDSGWKVKEPHRPPTSTTPKPSRSSRIPDVSRGVALGSFLNGVIEEILDTPREQTYRKNLLYRDPGNRAIYDAGRSAVDFFEDVFDAARDFYEDMWDNRQDVDFPAIDFPSLELPKIDFPSIELPRLDLPQFDLPDFDFPQFDFDPFNPFDRQRQQDRDKRKQNENDARQRRKDYDQTDDEKLEKFKNDLPDGCSATLFYIQHILIDAVNRTSTPFRPGPGFAKPVGSTYDSYGNRRDYYPDASGATGTGLLYPFDISLGTYVGNRNGIHTLHRQAYHNGIRNTTNLNDLFKLREEDSDGTGDYSTVRGYFLEKSKFKLYGVQVECNRPPPKPPIFNHPPQPPPPDPPEPPNPPQAREPEKPMSCCSCDDIAQIFQTTLIRLRYNITVPVVTCELVEGVWTPKVENKSLELFANSVGTATAQAELYRELAVQAQGNCEAKNLSNKIYEVIGGDEYPAEVPDSLISKDEGWLGNLIPNKTKKLKNLTEFLSWYVERFDEIMGQWEIPIEIKDSDPSKPGEQPVGVKLPNMAEAIAEMFSLCFQTNLNSETLLNMLLRTMGDSAADKRQNFITYKLLQSLTDYVGFKQKDIKLKMPLLFTLDKTRYSEILTNSEVEVGCVEFDEKFGLEKDLMRFRESAAILAAVYKKKIDPNGDIKAQVLKYLLDTLTATNKVNTDEEDDNFEQFIQDVEVGFTNAPGMEDAINPYGRPFTQCPKIRDLTKYKPPTP